MTAATTHEPLRITDEEMAAIIAQPERVKSLIREALEAKIQASARFIVYQGLGSIVTSQASSSLTLPRYATRAVDYVHNESWEFYGVSYQAFYDALVPATQYAADRRFDELKRKRADLDGKRVEVTSSIEDGDYLIVLRLVDAAS